MSSFIFSTTGLVATVLAILISKGFQIETIGPLAWFILVLGVDVSHVYSTIYRTYFNRNQIQKLGVIVWSVPLLCFGVAFALALLQPQYFWSAIAYVAIFHFSRQQIGFFRWLMAGQEPLSRPFWYFFEFTIYTSTLGSIVLWHLQGQKSFNWFTMADLFYLDRLDPILRGQLHLALQNVVIGFFAVSVLVGLFLFHKKRLPIHIPLLLISTFSSWYFPIVYFNSDFIFTMANVLAHGLPYMTLLWQEEKRTGSKFSEPLLFVGLIFVFALIEEAFWDAFVWRDHAEFFESFYFLPQIQGPSIGLAFILSILILPQLTHYVLDGFIWKKKYRE